MRFRRQRQMCIRDSNTIGTTLRGIGPTYEDKVARRAIRIIDTLSEKKLSEKLEENISYYDFWLEKYF